MILSELFNPTTLMTSNFPPKIYLINTCLQFIFWIPHCGLLASIQIIPSFLRTVSVSSYDISILYRMLKKTDFYFYVANLQINSFIFSINHFSKQMDRNRSGHEFWKEFEEYRNNSVITFNIGDDNWSPKIGDIKNQKEFLQ